ncbi:MAG TPA: AMP-binding protein [Polyangia bacterium]|nr:AMP-binding protein [Polyangia bacterium]
MKAATFNLADLFESVADAVPEREALISGERRLTYAALDERATRLANHLRARGVKAGDHVGLYLYNGHEYLEALLASFKLRAVPININYRYVAGELAYLCKNADLAAILHQQELGERVAAVAGEVPTLKWRLATGGAYEAALAESSPARDFAARSDDDLYIIYTGGTTGLPRGVMWRHRDVFFSGLQGGNPGGAHLEQPEEVAALAKSGDKAFTFLPAAPFIHGAAQWAALIGLNGGGKVVVSPGPRFDAPRVARLIADEKVTTLTLVGDAMARPLAEAITAAPDLDLSSLFVLASAGAILSRSVQEELQRRLPHTMILNNFGASETGHQGNASPDDPGARPRFYMDETTAVLDEELRPIAPGSGVTGKLARRGRIPIGYYNDPIKTAATFVTVGGERWVVPGDLARVEADGAITVLGRGAVCINSGGEKIFPEEVEEALKAHPKVNDAVVIGVPDERWGERVVALVQTRSSKDARNDARLTLDELDAHCRTRIAGYKIPRELHLVVEMVRHPSGKPDYRWAKAEAIARRKNGPPDDEQLVESWQLATLEAAGAWGERRRMAAAIRALAERCVAADVADDARASDFAAVADAIEAQVKMLDALPSKSTRAGFLDGSYRERRALFMDRGPLIGLSNPLAPPMRLSCEGETAIARVTFGAAFEGAPGYVHGGFVAAAFDQLFGYLGVLVGRPALTASLTVKYRKPTPLAVELRLEGAVDRTDGRKTFVRGRMSAGAELVAEAEGLFVAVGAEWFNALMQQL